MPGKIFSIIGIVLQYTLVILLYYFLYKVVKMIYLDLKTPALLASEISGQPFVEYKSDRARLTVIESTEAALAGQCYLIEETLTIGRNDHNDVIIHDNFTSHEHACVTKIKKNYWLYDLSSTNGTFLNGNRVGKEEALKDGDLIKIGTVTFKFAR